MSNKIESSSKQIQLKDESVADIVAETESDICFYGRDIPASEEELIVFNQNELAHLIANDYRPREIHIQASKTCNFKCTMCSWESWQSNVGMMSMTLFEQILEEARRNKVKKIVFANAQGEPMLHPQIIDMIQQAVSAGFWTMISTNGSPLNRENTQRLVATGIHHVQFSFGGYDKNSYETVYVGGKWEQITQHLKGLVQEIRRSGSTTSLVINGCYAKELEGLVSPNGYIAKTRAFLRSIGVWTPECQINLQLPHNFANNIHAISIAESEIDNSSYLKKTRKPGLCRVLKNAPGVYFDGKVTACGCLDPNADLFIGDLTKHGLAEIRHSDTYQKMLNDFIKADFSDLSLCEKCDIPYYETALDSPLLWENQVKLIVVTDHSNSHDKHPAKQLDDGFYSAVNAIARDAGLFNLLEAPDLEALWHRCHQILTAIESNSESMTKKIVHGENGRELLESLAQTNIKKITLVPATKIILENLDWFLNHFDEVYIGDNFKCGETHFNTTVLSVSEALSKQTDAYFLTTNTPAIEADYRPLLPDSKTITINELMKLPEIKWQQFLETGLARAKRILQEIEAAENPLVVVSSKLQATAEPMFVALESQDIDVFVVSLWDRMENRQRTGYDPACDVYRNVMVTGYEQLYIVQNLKKGKLWFYYDFFHNTGWDIENAIIAYHCAATMMNMASRPVILGMYDVIKPVCLNMQKQDQAFSIYKTMLDQADAVVLTSKSDHIADYLRNTRLHKTPVKSFYRYSFVPDQPLPKLSTLDGARHLVGVTSFLGEVFEPNRIETRNSIRSILQQGIHFHYYSNNDKVLDFEKSLPETEKKFFHIEVPIWDQRALVKDMSKFDAGWLVGDEASIFAKLICEVKDRFIRELFTLFVPNGVPTSSMTYGAAGLPVFISRQIKVMTEVYPEGCCIPLDMGEVPYLSLIMDRLDWPSLHQKMQSERHRFDIFAQIKSLADFINHQVSEPVKTYL